MNISTIKNIYFIGIGGIGMSALARFFKQRGIMVSGYDKTPTPLTQQLQQEGISIHFNDDIQALDKKAEVVVYTPAIPSTNLELNWYKENNYSVLKRSDILQYISESMQAICVAGTHGKTTISTLIAHILRHTQYGCNAFLGGISSNYESNYWQSDNNVAVIEADEYDRSFLKLSPSIAVLTAMDADHLDIYGTTQEMEKCYLQFVTQIKDTLVYKHGLPHASLFHAPQKVSYSLQNSAATYYAENIVARNGSYTFSVCKNEEQISELTLNIGGMHNVENTVAALAVCDLLQLDKNKVAQAISEFKGVKRRFEYIIKNNDYVYIDDYAHHPEELKMLISSAKSLFRNKKCSIVFQPHLYTRTRDLCNGFAESLDIADEIILLDIYPARELPIEGITSQIIFDKLNTTNKHIFSKQAMLDWVKYAKPQLLITAGAGDIDSCIQDIKHTLLNA